jgi:4-amino-4-deoxy-L-arabinose transferase-like glycosyltransferase
VPNSGIRPERDASVRLSRPLPFLLLLLLPVFVLYAWGIDWGAPLLWVYDEIKPQQVLTSMNKGLAAGWPARYPTFHYWLLAPATWLFLKLGGSSGAAAAEWQPALLVTLRWLSVAMATATVAVVYRVARQALDRAGALFSAAVAAVPVTTVYYSKLVNLEAPYVFWFALSLLGFFRALDRQRLRDYMLFAVAAAAAVSTKDQAYGLYVLAPVPLVACWWRRHRDLPPRSRLFALLRDPRLLLSAAVALAIFLLAHRIPFEPSLFARHVKVMTGAKIASFEMYEPSLAGHLSMLGAAARQVAFGLGIPLCVASLVGAVLVARDRRRKERLLLGSAALLAAGYYLSFVAVVRFQFDRYYMPVFLVMALFAGRAFATFARWPRLPVVARAAVLTAILGWALLRGLALDLMMVNDSRNRLAAAIEASAVGDRVFGVGGRHDLPAVRSVPWNQVVRAPPAALDARGARYVVVNATHIRHARLPPSQKQFYADLLAHRLPYRTAFTYRWQPRLDPIGLDSRCFTSVVSSLCWINPELVVLERVGEHPDHPRLDPP